MITPHRGSEPHRQLGGDGADRQGYSILLLLTTNIQVFDEQRFHEVEDHMELIAMSIDSHIPELFEKIRPGAKPEQVYRHVKAVAPVCSEHGIECVVQIVFMTENASTVPEDASLRSPTSGATSFGVIQLIDVNRRSWLSRSARSTSRPNTSTGSSGSASGCRGEAASAWVEPVRTRVGRLPREGTKGDHARESGPEPHPGRADAPTPPGLLQERLQPASDHAEGTISPCSLDSDGELVMGSLRKQDFDEIWNGPNARDLRRAHTPGTIRASARHAAMSTAPSRRLCSRFWTTYSFGATARAMTLIQP